MGVLSQRISIRISVPIFLGAAEAGDDPRVHPVLVLAVGVLFLGIALYLLLFGGYKTIGDRPREKERQRQSAAWLRRNPWPVMVVGAWMSAFSAYVVGNGISQLVQQADKDSIFQTIMGLFLLVFGLSWLFFYRKVACAIAQATEWGGSPSGWSQAKSALLVAGTLCGLVGIALVYGFVLSLFN